MFEYYLIFTHNGAAGHATAVQSHTNMAYIPDREPLPNLGIALGKLGEQYRSFFDKTFFETDEQFSNVLLETILVGSSKGKLAQMLSTTPGEDFPTTPGEEFPTPGQDLPVTPGQGFVIPPGQISSATPGGGHPTTPGEDLPMTPGEHSGEETKAEEDPAIVIEDNSDESGFGRITLDELVHRTEVNGVVIGDIDKYGILHLDPDLKKKLGVMEAKIQKEIKHFFVQEPTPITPSKGEKYNKFIYRMASEASKSQLKGEPSHFGFQGREFCFYGKPFFCSYNTTGIAGRLAALCAPDGGCALAVLLLLIQPCDDDFTYNTVHNDDVGDNLVAFGGSYLACYHLHMMTLLHDFIKMGLNTPDKRAPTDSGYNAITIDPDNLGNAHGIKHNCGCSPHLIREYWTEDATALLFSFCARHGTIEFNKGLQTSHEFLTVCLKNVDFATDYTHLPIAEIPLRMVADEQAKRKFQRGKDNTFVYKVSSVQKSTAWVNHPSIIAHTKVLNGGNIPTTTLKDDKCKFMRACLGMFAG